MPKGPVTRITPPVLRILRVKWGRERRRDGQSRGSGQLRNSPHLKIISMLEKHSKPYGPMVGAHGERLSRGIRHSHQSLPVGRKHSPLACLNRDVIINILNRSTDRTNRFPGNNQLIQLNFCVNPKKGRSKDRGSFLLNFPTGRIIYDLIFENKIRRIALMLVS